MEASTSRAGCRRYYNRSDQKQRSASEHSTKRLPRNNTERSHSTESWRENKTTTNDETIQKISNSKNTQTFEEYKSEIICPFCLKIQKDSNDMVRHLDTKCKFKIKKEIPFTTFQILPSNKIKCNQCHLVLDLIENYFQHGKNHSGNSEFLFCFSCKVHILDNYIQLKRHMEHDIHLTRSKSMLDSQHYINRGITCIYCFYGENKKFKCLTCPPPSFLFDTPQEIIQHFKTPRHINFLKEQLLVLTIYCCFCDEIILNSEINYHFTTKKHWGKTNKITGVGSYKLCLYCGFACKMLKSLSEHMRSDCDEIKKIKSTLGLVGRQRTTTIQEAKPNQREINKEKCILVNNDHDIVELSKTLKRFGKITHVDHYDDDRMVIEFKKEEAVETLLLFSSFIKINGEKLKVEFFTETEDEE